MSEIRPTNARPDIQRPQAERPVKTERRAPDPVNQQAAHKTEAQHEVARRDVSKSTKPKGGNVDITV